MFITNQSHKFLMKKYHKKILKNKIKYKIINKKNISFIIHDKI